MNTSQIQPKFKLPTELNPITYQYILVVLIVIIILFFSYNLIKNTIRKMINAFQVIIPRINLIYL